MMKMESRQMILDNMPLDLIILPIIAIVVVVIIGPLRISKAMQNLVEYQKKVILWLVKGIANFFRKALEEHREVNREPEDNRLYKDEDLV